MNIAALRNLMLLNLFYKQFSVKISNQYFNCLNNLMATLILNNYNSKVAQLPFGHPNIICTAIEYITRI